MTRRKPNGCLIGRLKGTPNRINTRLHCHVQHLKRALVNRAWRGIANRSQRPPAPRKRVHFGCVNVPKAAEALHASRMIAPRKPERHAKNTDAPFVAMGLRQRLELTHSC